jgi:hypothetical protein
MFPDGFKMEIGGDGATWTDVGVLAGGAVATFNWEPFALDAGNYEGLIDYLRNPTVALAPSALWNWDPAVIAEVFGGFFLQTPESGGPYAGENLDYAGEKNVKISRKYIRLTHHTVDATDGAATDADIDWQFTLYNAMVDPGASFNLKGVNEDGLNEISVSFTAKADPENAYRLVNFFKAYSAS